MAQGAAEARKVVVRPARKKAAPVSIAAYAHRPAKKKDKN